jgi:hypothetical protein
MVLIACLFWLIVSSRENRQWKKRLGTKDRYLFGFPGLPSLFTVSSKGEMKAAHRSILSFMAG